MTDAVAARLRAAVLTIPVRQRDAYIDALEALLAVVRPPPDDEAAR
jgi:hypothetical protein